MDKNTSKLEDALKQLSPELVWKCSRPIILSNAMSR